MAGVMSVSPSSFDGDARAVRGEHGFDAFLRRVRAARGDAQGVPCSGAQPFRQGRLREAREGDRAVAVGEGRGQTDTRSSDADEGGEPLRAVGRGGGDGVTGAQAARRQEPPAAVPSDGEVGLARIEHAVRRGGIAAQADLDVVGGRGLEDKLEAEDARAVGTGGGQGVRRRHLAVGGRGPRQGLHLQSGGTRRQRGCGNGNSDVVFHLVLLARLLGLRSSLATRRAVLVRARLTTIAWQQRRTPSLSALYTHWQIERKAKKANCRGENKTLRWLST